MKKVKIKVTHDELSSASYSVNGWCKMMDAEQKENLLWKCTVATLTALNFRFSQKLVMHQNKYLLTLSVAEGAALVYCFSQYINSPSPFIQFTANHFVSTIHKQL